MDKPTLRDNPEGLSDLIHDTAERSTARMHNMIEGTSETRECWTWDGVEGMKIGTSANKDEAVFFVSDSSKKTPVTCIRISRQSIEKFAGIVAFAMVLMDQAKEEFANAE